MPHALHARLPKNFVLEERLERYASVIELTPQNLRGSWAQACWPGVGAEAGDAGHMWVPNVLLGQTIGFLCRFVPAMIVLGGMTAASTQADFATIIPDYVTTCLTTFGGMMTALGMGILLSFLVKQNWYLVIFMVGFMLVTYFNLSMMGVAILAAIVAVVYYKSDTLKAVKGVE